MMTIVICLTYPLEQLDAEFQPFHHGLYDGLGRVCWSISLCYIIFACAHNAGGVLNRFLSHPLWVPFSRLSYSIYLVHIPVLIATTARMKTPFNVTHSSLLQNIILTYILTLLVAMIAALLFESPVVAIEKMIFNAVVKHQNGTNATVKANGIIQMIHPNGLKEKNI